MAKRDRYRVARVYDDATDDDGHRILVDRLWPRGLRKDGADIEEWLKDVAPSADLRKWYGHDPGRFDEFAQRYREELDGDAPRQALQTLHNLTGTVTLLTATKDLELSHATVLAGILGEAGGHRSAASR